MGRAGSDIAVLAVEFGAARDEVDRAAGRVAAVERPLRAAHNLDLVQIVELLAVARTAGLIDFVDIDADRRCRIGVEIGADADAAHREVRLLLAGRRGPLEVRHGALAVAPPDPDRNTVLYGNVLSGG